MKINVVGMLEKGKNLILHKLEKSIGWRLWFEGATIFKIFCENSVGSFQSEIVDITDVLIYCREDKGDSPFFYRPEQGAIRRASE